MRNDDYHENLRSILDLKENDEIWRSRNPFFSHEITQAKVMASTESSACSWDPINHLKACQSSAGQTQLFTFLYRQTLTALVVPNAAGYHICMI